MRQQFAGPGLAQHLFRRVTQEVFAAVTPHDAFQVCVDQVESVVEAFQKIEVRENMAEQSGVTTFRERPCLRTG